MSIFALYLYLPPGRMVGQLHSGETVVSVATSDTVDRVRKLSNQARQAQVTQWLQVPRRETFQRRET